MPMNTSVDVLVVGGGPVGLLIAYQLVRAGCTVHIVDKDDKSNSNQYGRANAIYARSAELLDQLGLAQGLLQQCHIVRESYTYDRNGKRVIPGRVWNFVENIDDTKFDFGIMLRQQYIERHFRERLAELGVTLRHSTECTNIATSDAPDVHDYNITASMKDLKSGADYTIQSKFLIGADGGQSFVRKCFGVPFEGGRTEDRWIRIDGKIKTDMPTPRAYASIESPTHGNVLWAPLDRGITRIGYVFTSEQERRCEGQVTQEAAMKEAIEAVKPFHIEYESVEWWTLYIIGQRVAATYRPHPRVILAGDACHTHSSGAAQGLNTGIHDASNLGWKLALVLTGAAKENLLDTYDAERRAAAQRLINFDRKISTLMANKWPDDLPRTPGQDINQALAELFDDAAGYNTGLGISYDENLINVRSSSEKRNYYSIAAGGRAPDTDLLMPGTLQPIRLHDLTPNKAQFYILAFVGDPRITLPRIVSLAADMGAFLDLFAGEVVKVIAIVATSNTRLSVDEALGVHPFGAVYYDTPCKSHRRYGVDVRYGSLVVLRPDGYVGFSTEMSDKGLGSVRNYLERFLVLRS